MYAPHEPIKRSWRGGRQVSRFLEKCAHPAINNSLGPIGQWHKADVDTPSVVVPKSKRCGACPSLIRLVVMDSYILVSYTYDTSV